MRAGALALALGSELAACEAAPRSAPATTPRPGAVGHEAAPPDAGAAALDPPAPGDAPGKVVVVTTSDECGLILDQVYFAPNEASPLGHQRPVLDETAEMFRCFRRTGVIRKWQVVGHADATERDPLALSLARARTVAAALVARGVAAASLHIDGYGAARPQDRRGTPAALAKNRRVSFFVLERAGGSP